MHRWFCVLFLLISLFNLSWSYRSREPVIYPAVYAESRIGTAVANGPDNSVFIGSASKNLIQLATLNADTLTQVLNITVNDLAAGVPGPLENFGQSIVYQLHTGQVLTWDFGGVSREFIIVGSPARINEDDTAGHFTLIWLNADATGVDHYQTIYLDPSVTGQNAEVGYSLSLYGFDQSSTTSGQLALFVGAPGYSSNIGRVFFVELHLSASAPGEIPDATLDAVVPIDRPNCVPSCDNDRFGFSVLVLDFNYIVVSSSGSPALHFLLFNYVGQDSEATEQAKITPTGTFTADDLFGAGLTSLGDLDGDGAQDIAVGVPRRSGIGSVILVYLTYNPTISIKYQTTITQGSGFISPATGNTILSGKQFGESIVMLNAPNSDGYPNLLVGSPLHEKSGAPPASGSLYLLPLDVPVISWDTLTVTVLEGTGIDNRVLLSFNPETEWSYVYEISSPSSGPSAALPPSTADFEVVTPVVPEGVERTNPEHVLFDSHHYDSVADTVDEYDESFEVTVMTPRNVKINPARQTFQAVILDNNLPPTVQFDSATQSVTEGDIAQLSVQLSQVSEKTVTVNVEVIPGTATLGPDFSAPPAVLTFAPLSLTPDGEFLEISILEDDIDEYDETLDVVLHSPNEEDVTVDTPGTVTLTILDNDPLPTLVFCDETLEIVEGDSDSACVKLFGDTYSEKVITFSLNVLYDPIPAAEPEDFLVSTGPFTIEPGQQQILISVSAISDSVDEYDEKFSLQITNPSEAEAGTENLEITIIDDDIPPVISFEAQGGLLSVLEDIGSVAFSVKLDVASEKTVTASVTLACPCSATEIVDYVYTQCDVVFLPGETTYTCQGNTEIVDNAIVEPTESFFLELGSLVDATLGDPSSLEVSINDDDGVPTLLFSDISPIIVIEANTTVTIHARLTKTISEPLEFSIVIVPEETTATANADFVPPESFDYIIPAETTTDIDITFKILDDSIYDKAGEKIVFAFSDANAEGIQFLVSNQTLVVFIQDDEGPPVASFPANLDERTESNSLPFDFVVTLSHASERQVIVNTAVASSGTAILDTDYAIATSLLLDFGGANNNPSLLSRSIALQILGDALDEDLETFTIEFVETGSQNVVVNPSASSGTVGIIDNDDPPLALFQTISFTINEGDSVAVPVSLSTVSGRDVVIQFSFGGTASSGASLDYTSFGTVTIPAGTTQTTLDVQTFDDDMYENSIETVIITIVADALNPSDAHYNPGSPFITTISIQNINPPPTVFWEANTRNFLEPAVLTTVNTPFLPIVKLDKISGLSVTVNFVITGTAVPGNDYEWSALTTVIIPAGTQSAPIPAFEVKPDSLYEHDETIIFTFLQSDVTNGVVTEAQVCTFTITNDDPKPKISFVAATQTVAEGASFNLNLKLDVPSGLDCYITNLEITGTATPPDPSPAGAEDWNNAGIDNLRINAGASVQVLNFPTVDDILYEHSETLTFTLVETNEDCVLADTLIERTITITSDDIMPQVSFPAEITTSVEEDATVENVVLELDPVSGVTTTIQLVYTGTAKRSGVVLDYAAAVSISIPEGESSVLLPVTIFEDSLYEHNETIEIAFASVQVDVTASTPDSHTIIIINDDSVSEIEWASSSSSIVEGASPNTIAVEAHLSKPTGTPISFIFAVVGGTALEATSGSNPDDYDLPASLVVNVPGDDVTTTVFTGEFTIHNDNFYELSETIVIQITSSEESTIGEVFEHTITILNDDDTPGVSFDTLPFSSINEDGVSYQLTSRLTAPSAVPCDLTLTYSGQAVAGQDFSFDSGVTINPFTLTKPTTVQILDDELNEADETFSLTITNPINCVATDPFVNTMTILDNDPDPFINFPAVGPSQVEGGQMTITATLTTAGGTVIQTGVALTIPITVTGTATSGSDYVSLPAEITIGAGQSSGSITITTMGDSIYEGSETVIVSLQAANYVVLGTTSSITATILDAQSPPTLSWSVETQSVLESDISFTVTARLTVATTTDTIVQFTASGTAQTPGDYSLDSSITIPAGTTQGSITGTLEDDGISETTETIILTLQSSTPSYVLSAPTTHTVIIADESSSVMSFVSAGAVSESVGTVTIQITLSAAVAEDFTVQVTQGTPVSPAVPASSSDWTGTSFPLTVNFAAGSTSASFQISVVDDTIYEASETLIFNLGIPSSGLVTLGSPISYTLLINDNDAQPFVALSAPASVNEGQSFLVTATLYSDSTDLTTTEAGVVVTVPFTLGGDVTTADFEDSIPPSVTIPSGSTSATVSIKTFHDGLHEGNEEVIITRGDTIENAQPHSTGGVVSVVIIDHASDIAPRIFFSTTPDQHAQESGVFVLGVALETVSGLDASIEFSYGGTAADGEDYTGPTSVTIPASQQSTTITLTITEDDVYENDETVIVNMINPTDCTLGNPTVYTLTIDNDDSLPQVAFSTGPTTVNESVGTVSITVTLDIPSALSVSVTVSASASSTMSAGEYSFAPSTVTFAPGETSKTVTVTIENDSLDEPTETIVLQLSSPVNADLGTSSVVITVDDDDPVPTVSFVSAGQSVDEGVGVVNIAVVLSAASGRQVSVTLNVEGNATNEEDYSDLATSVSFTAGQTTKNITFNVIDDTVAEPTETVAVKLGTATNGQVASPSTHTVTILDNDEIEPSSTVGTDTGAETDNDGDGTDQITLSAAISLRPFSLTW